MSEPVKDEQFSQHELNDRLSLIEGMIAEGRHTTGRWGWAFTLWGLAYLIAFAWMAWNGSSWAWPVTMDAGTLATIAIASRRIDGAASTILGRAIGALWMATGISMFLLFLVLGFTGRLTDPHIFAATLAAILGLANGASAMMLRWRVQLTCALVWWAAAVAACFGSNTQSMAVLIAAIVLCLVVFGIYTSIAESRHRSHASAHA